MGNFCCGGLKDEILDETRAEIERANKKSHKEIHG